MMDPSNGPHTKLEMQTRNDDGQNNRKMSATVHIVVQQTNTEKLH